MYELPSAENISKVVIDEKVIKGEAQPYMVYESEEMPRAVSE